MNQEKMFGNLINGEWRISQENKPIDVLSPVDGSLVGRLSSMSQKELDEAIATAKRAQKSWCAPPTCCGIPPMWEKVYRGKPSSVTVSLEGPGIKCPA